MTKGRVLSSEQIGKEPVEINEFVLYSIAV
jgi:hypothetical protein